MAKNKNEEVLTRLWDGIMSLAEYRKEIPIKNKVWIANLPGWKIVVNGTEREVTYDGFKIFPYNCAIWFGDWLAGSFSPFEGIIAAGSLANADSLIEVIKKQIRRAHQ